MSVPSGPPNPSASSPTSPSPTSSSPGAPTRRASVPLLVAAGAIVVGVVGLVLLFGIARPPTLDTVADSPDPAPPAQVAWMSSEPGRDTCLHIAEVGGGSREVTCDLEDGELIAWDEEGIVLRPSAIREALRWIDPVTGERVERRELDPDQQVDRQGDAVSSRTRDGQVQVVFEPSGEVIWETDAPESYHLYGGSISADGDWVAVTDAADRLLLLATDGRVPPRQWSSAKGATWSTVWEGTPLPVEDLE